MPDIRKLLTSTISHFRGLIDQNITVFRRAADRFEQNRAQEAAAAIAFFALFSLFPLLLFLIGVASYIFQGAISSGQLLDNLSSIIPVSPELITRNIDRVLALRKAFNLIALLGFLWSASSVFNSLVKNINRAWSNSRPRGFLRRRILAFAIVGGVVGLAFLSLLATTVLNLLPKEWLPDQSILWRLLSNNLPFLVRLLLAWALYHWVPDTHVNFMPAFGGAVFTAIAWEATTATFIWYLSSGFGDYKFVYGSLGAIVALMFWMYLSSWILLFGAYLTAAIQETFAESR